MAERPRSSASSTRSWRGQGGVRQPTPGNRWVNRVLMTLFGAALLGLLGWLLWWWAFLPRIHLFALPIVHYDVLAVPPIPFATEDVAELTAGAPDGPDVDSQNVLLGLETSEGIRTLASRLEGVLTRPRDTLVLYVSAHGVSDGETAYLLCSDYMREAGEGRYSLHDLLGQVAECQGRLKLLILDTGHIAADPRLGMVVNEFPRLVEQEVAKTELPGDSELWVLGGNGCLESSQVSYPMRRSVFGSLVAKGLQGAADLNENREVELDELFRFLCDGVTAWSSQRGEGLGTQTPWLLQAGKGATDPPRGVALVPAAKKRAEGESQDESQAEPEAEATGSGAEKDDREAAGSKDEADGAKKAKAGAGDKGEAAAKEAPDPKDDAPQDPARLEARELLNKAWALRDEIQRRVGVDAWSPVDYAPHLWRELQELLLGYESQWRCGTAFDAKKLADDLKANVLPIERVMKDGSPPPEADRSTLSRLAEARRQFLAGAAKASYEGAPDELGVVKEAIQLKNDLLFRAPYYVRWHERVSLGATRTVSLYEPIEKLLGEGLPEFVDLLDSLEDLAAGSGTSSADVRTRLKQIGAKQEELEKLCDEIEQEGLQREAQECLAEIGRGTSQDGPAAGIDNLLRTPLLAAPLRMELLDALEGLAPPSPEAGAAAATSKAGASQVATWQWDRLSERARLAVLIVEAADPGFAAGLDWPTSEERALSTLRSADQEEARWSRYRRLGAGLRTFYEGLPQRIAGGVASSDPAEVRLTERLLRVVDARDAAGIHENAWWIAVRPLPRLPLTEEGFKIAGPDTLKLSPDAPEGWTRLEFTVQATGEGAANAWLTVQYDPGLLAVESLEGTPPVQPNRQTQVPLTRDRGQKFSYRVRPVVEVETEVTRPMVFKVRAGQRTESHTVEITVPAPDVVDLVVQGTGPTTDDRTEEGGFLRLRPYPNRLTTYRFELVNRSGRAKSTLVQLLALPEAAATRGRNRDLLFDGLGSLRPDVQALGEPLSVELPAEPTAVPLPFPDPKALAPKGDAAKPDATKPDAAGEAGGPEERPAITHGLACVIRDAAGKEWIRWIDFLPLLPRDYLEPEVSYNLLQRRITIQVKARDTDGDGNPNQEVLPPLTPESAISVVWETAGVLDPSTEMNDQAGLAPPAYQANLFAVVESGRNKEVPVRLSIDGYPRAFIYRVRCDSDRRNVARQRSTSQIRITAPSADQAYLAPLDSLTAEFQVDAPEDAFQQAGDVVEVGIDANGDRQLLGEERRQLFADRQVVVLLDKAEPGGMVTVDTRVTDFTVPLSPGGLRNRPVGVLARLVLPSLGRPGDPVVAEDSVRVLLDGADPVLSKVDVPGRPVPQGTELPVSVKTEDLSGVEKLELGFDLDGSSDLEESEKPKTLQQKIVPQLDAVEESHAQDWPTTLLPTKDLEPGRYSLIVRATDRVNRRAKRMVLVEIAAPPDKSRPPTSTIVGRVMLGDFPVANIEVQIEKTNLAATTDQNGQFIFKNVPHGAHKLLAKGVAKNQEREGSAEVTLPAPQEPATVDIRLE